MKSILLLGAGRSSSVLIDYLLTCCGKYDWKLTVGDRDVKLAGLKIKGHSRGNSIALNVQSDDLERYVDDADLVISMLPARFHDQVAETCVKCGKHLITASYVSDTIRRLNEEAENKGIILLNECGLDPGLDHMSGKKVLDDITGEYTIHGFETFTGGLLAPTEEDNPWHYKFTWNPRNVVLAGQGGVKFIQEGKYKYIPYHRLFRRTEVIHIPGYGYFEGYANRDSLRYRKLYGLENIKTIFRGTFRRPGFCASWDIFVQLGATDDTYEMEGVPSMTHRDFINSFLSYNPNDSVELKLAHYMHFEMESEEMYKMKWLGIFDDEPVGLERGTPAQVLEHILKKKWTMTEADRDMIVMLHKVSYYVKNELKEYHATMVVTGENSTNTAMAKTVGLPMGIAAKLILHNKINRAGVQIPTFPEIYIPVLDELKEMGFDFIEEVIN